MRKALVITSICVAIIAIPAGCAENKKGLGSRARISPKTHIASGKMLEAQRNYFGAATQYQQAIEAQPNLTIAYHRLAELYLKLGRFDEAGVVLRSAIEAGADEASLRNNLGYALMRMGRFDEAEQMLASALAMSPTFHRARMNLGLLHARAGRIDESIETFERIVPREDALYNVAIIRMHERDYVTAAWAFGEAVQIEPSFADARTQLKKAMFLARHSPQRSADVDLLNAVARTPAPTEPTIVARAAHQAVTEYREVSPPARPATWKSQQDAPPEPAAPTVAVATAPKPKPEPAAMRDISSTTPRPQPVVSEISTPQPVAAAPTPIAAPIPELPECPDEVETPEPTVLVSATPSAVPMLPPVVVVEAQPQPASQQPEASQEIPSVPATPMTPMTPTTETGKTPVASMTAISMN